MEKIFYLPFHSDLNSYTERMKIYLKKYGELHKISKKTLFKKIFRFKREDVIITNWVENSIIKNRKFSYSGLLKVIFAFLIFKFLFRDFIYFKHNNYPHDCQKKDIAKVKAVLKIIEKIPNKVVIHSPKESNNFYYVPHPLYEDILDDYPLNKLNDTYVIFGRITSYKKIENVINVFPDSKKLIIAGSCSDLKYLNELKALIGKKENIEIFPKFFSDLEAKELIVNSAGILITHNDDDMIVSGSFFYALTMRSRVYALQTPFLQWAAEQLGVNHLHISANLNDMMNTLISTSEIDNHTLKKPNDLFGETAMQYHLDKVFNFL